MVTIKVGVNGFGAIGKRVALAVSLQKDMKLVGIANRSVNINVRHLAGPKGRLKTGIYCSDPNNLKKMQSTGFKVSGSLDDLLEKVDVIVDGTPAGIEAQYKPLYKKHGVKQIYEGGADKSIAQVSFNAIANYNDAWGKESARVVSCNTTSLARTIYTANKAMKIKEVLAVLVRRATDPPEDDREGPINSIVPVTKIPSHHGPDVQTVLPKVKILTMACKVPTTLSHVHFVTATLQGKYTREDALDAFRKGSRMMLFKAADGYESSAQIAEAFRDMNRMRADMYEVGIWDETVNVDKGKLYWAHAVHSEAIVVPESVDAIRSLMKAAPQKKSIELTNKSLGIDK